jgi:hypothetical protein
MQARADRRTATITTKNACRRSQGGKGAITNVRRLPVAGRGLKLNPNGDAPILKKSGCSIPKNSKNRTRRPNQFFERFAVAVGRRPRIDREIWPARNSSNGRITRNRSELFESNRAPLARRRRHHTDLSPDSRHGMQQVLPARCRYPANARCNPSMSSFFIRSMA